MRSELLAIVAAMLASIAPGPTGSACANGGDPTRAAAAGPEDKERRARAPRSRRPQPRSSTSAIAFADVTAAVGIADMGISHGVSVGDCNGDGWPDIFTGGHYMAHPRLWRNLGNGSFVDDTIALMPLPHGDNHGAQWFDADNDGVQELYVTGGAGFGLGAAPKRQYRRSGAFYFDVAAAVGLDLPLMRGRTPLAVDADGDGLLDLLMAAQLRPDLQSPPSLYQQRGGRFREVGAALGFGVGVGTEFGVLGDLDGDGKLDALFDGYPRRAYSFLGGGVQNITTTIGLPPLAPFPTMHDAVIADLTGDGRNDVYMARDATRSAAHRDGPLAIEFVANLDGDEHGIRFGSLPGHVLWLDWGGVSGWTTADVFIGAQGWNPSQNGVPLDPSDPANSGIAPHAPGQSRGIYIGWDAAALEWVCLCSTPVWAEALIRFICSLPVTVPQAIGYAPGGPNASDVLFVRVGNGPNGGYANQTVVSGIPSWLRGRSVVAADFDNDMDLDLYVERSTQSCNLDNVLLENLGGGMFALAPAGVAVGSPDGIGDSVATFDYDRDGLVDLLLVNGLGSAFRLPSSPGAFADDGRTQLLRNVTANGNHWLGIELVGTTSNRDGIGARVQVLAGGVSQIREHGGGMHRHSQNHGIHFGLGQNAVTKHVIVDWPSGQRTVVRGVAADQVLTIVE
ncbi:MAG: CRTAC1 family protein [Planctomycetes bacterium]|nr:CRTAC1 family protein [Planctomycetota bacterium]